MLAAAPLRAQCPDGSPPPCAQRVAVLDPHLIAILPFRVTAADTLLGQGMAELLAPEFNGENGPLAVNMPTVLRVWRRAGGGLRTPLDPTQARRVARTMGAGRLVDGSVVGLGGLITVTAALTELPSGAIRRVGPLSGPADSLQSLVGRLASALLSATGTTPSNLQIRLTDSPAAIRAYLEGIAQYRVGDFQRAAAAFERAFAMDTLFARAALMRMAAGVWGVGMAGWDSVTWRIRDRLSAQDRIYLTAFPGHYPAWRSPEQVLADQRRSANLFPQSAEAQFWLGDYLFHAGSVINIADDFASARAQLELAYGMDPQFEEVEHLLEIGFYTGDTSLVRRMWAEWRRLGGTPGLTPTFGRVVARVLHDSVLGARDDVAPGERMGRWWWSAAESAIALLPAYEVARVFDVPSGGVWPAGSQSSGQSLWLSSTAVNTGRLAWLPDSSQTARPHWQIVAATLALAGDSVIAAALARPTNTAQWPSAGGPLRAASVALIEALRSNQANLRERATRLDSMVRWDIANFNRVTGGYEGLLLSVAWERLDEPSRALTAVQLDAWELDVAFLLAPRLRQEGRLAVIVGDTARAIRASRRYLSLRRDADPVLIPERDSIQAALARLEGSRLR